MEGLLSMHVACEENISSVWYFLKSCSRLQPRIKTKGLKGEVVSIGSPRGRVDVVDPLLQHALDQVGRFGVVRGLEHSSQGRGTETEAGHLEQIEGF